MVRRDSIAIVGCLSPVVRNRLLSQLPEATVYSAWRLVEPAIQRADSTLLFVDPLVVDGCAQQVMRLRERYPSVAVVVYTVLDPAPMQQVVQLAHAGVSEIVFLGFDDKPERLARIVEEAIDAAAQSLTPLEPLLGKLTPALRRSVVEMFRQPRLFRSTLDLAAAAGISPRAAFRHLKAAGFASPRRLVAGARVLRAFQLLGDRGRSGTEVAKRLGYRGVDQLSQHLAELAGCTVSDIRRGLGPTDFVATVFRSLTQYAPVSAGSTEEVHARVG